MLNKYKKSKPICIEFTEKKIKNVKLSKYGKIWGTIWQRIIF